MRQCGGCTLCCKLMPVAEIDKPASARCQHQQTGKGCKVYRKPGFPSSCHLWSCKWLNDPDCADLSRPDRSHYVIDMMPDFVTLQPNDGSAPMEFPVLQIWCDPKYPDAHRDPALRHYLESINMPALIRYNSKDGIGIFPPGVTGAGWVEQVNGTSGRQHSAREIATMLEKFE